MTPLAQPRGAGRRIRLGIVSNEFFDPALGRMGGFGWVTKEAGLCFRNDPGQGVDPVFATGEVTGPPGAAEVRSHGIPLVPKQPSRAEQVRHLRSRHLDLLLAVDYRPNFDDVLDGLPDLPVIVWVQDPRPPEDVEKVNTLRVPGAGDARPQGIVPVDCSPLGAVVARSLASGRRVLFACPAPSLLPKVAGTYRVQVPGLAFLPYILDFDPGPIGKSARPRVVFLGRLDPIKRPWLFAELARRFPLVEFVFMGKTHFRGEGAWEPAGLPGNVRCLGHVEGAEKVRLLTSAWALVNTSIHEALPVSFLEALLCRVPILSCQDPEGVTSRFGVYTGRWDGSGLEGVPAFAEGLKRLLEDRTLRARLGADGQRWARGHHGRDRFLVAFHEFACQALAAEDPAGPAWLAPAPPHGRPTVIGPTAWEQRRRHAIGEVAGRIPAGERVLLVDDQQWGIEDLDGRPARPFLERDGQYWGPPPDDETAVRELERMRREGAGFLVVGWPAFWWLDHYAGWHRHLRAHYPCILENDRLVVFNLRG